MTEGAKAVIRTYVGITSISTLAESLIWSINTFLLLDAGLTIGEAFAANAFFSLGFVVFEIPTGVIADTWGRRASYLIGLLTVTATTLLYILLWSTQAPFAAWAAVSFMIGFGFTFFSGAVEAWLVDALDATKYKGALESVFAKGQIAWGAAMLSGALLGGVIAQTWSLSTPYVLRSILLVVAFVLAYRFMKDLGFEPDTNTKLRKHVKEVLKSSLDHGLKKPQIRWVMLSSAFFYGIGGYVFYAMQPYLLELYGDDQAYAIAGIAASAMAASQIAGGLAVGLVRRIFNRRTTVMLLGVFVFSGSLFGMAMAGSFAVAFVFLVIWSTVFAGVGPVRQAYLNKLIPSKQRATVLSFDALISSIGGTAAQPGFGKIADVWGYSASYAVAAGVNLIAAPLIGIARCMQSPADKIEKES